MTKIIGCCLENARGKLHSFVSIDKQDGLAVEAKNTGQNLHLLVSQTDLKTEAGQIVKTALASIEGWKNQHEIHKDYSSYRCYSSALVRAIIEINVFIKLLDMYEYSTKVVELIEELDALDKQFSSKR